MSKAQTFRCWLFCPLSFAGRLFAHTGSQLVGGVKETRLRGCTCKRELRRVDAACTFVGGGQTVFTSANSPSGRCLWVGETSEQILWLCLSSLENARGSLWSTRVRFLGRAPARTSLPVLPLSQLCLSTSFYTLFHLQTHALQSWCFVFLIDTCVILSFLLSPSTFIFWSTAC